jgi:thiamine-phosphate pyrophosphorylase
VIRIYLITPPKGDPADAVRAALAVLPPGVAGVQLRQELSAGALLERAVALREICAAHGAPFLVNDRVDVALSAGADGVHLPARGLPPAVARAMLGPGKLIGASAHSPRDVVEAAKAGADFCVFGPVFETPGKTAQGLDGLASACRAASVPVLGLGGVTHRNASRCTQVGAAGVACIRSILGSPDPAAAAILLWQAISLCLLLFFAYPARADDSRYQDYPVGSRAIALGGSFVALSDDPSGLFYNPAGICDTRRLNVNVSASLYGFERQSRGAITLPGGTFSLAGLNELNVIPGEVGLLKGSGKLDDRGTPFAYGFDVTVPTFRSYGVDSSAPFQVHTRVMDRTFNLAAGVAARIDPKLNVGFALHYVLRLYETSEDALSVTGQAAQPTVGVYHATASFENANLVGLLGAKYHSSDEWTWGLSLGLPGIPVHSSGSVTVQDVVSDPAAAGNQVTLKRSGVNSRTFVPALLRAGFAWIKPHRWTVTGQITGHLGTNYDRFSVEPAIEQRLRVQDHIERNPVIDLNAGGEYLLNADYSVAMGLFTSRSGAPEFTLNPDGTLAPGSSRQPRVSLYGATATLGVIGQHAISRLGISAAYGTGDDAVPNDPTGIIDPTGFKPAGVKQLFLYVFLASTFRY